MQKRDVFYIADISGFTSFVKKNEQNHSKHIIGELLDLIIEHKKSFFTLVEIEGDAVFFYAKENSYTQDDLTQHVEELYLRFHNHLKLYESKRICPCGACVNASNLNLKFIYHFGTLDFITVQGREKPYGKDVILTHRLLKNSINSNGYLLVSNSEQLNMSNSNWHSNSDRYDNDDVSYVYHELSYLDDQIKMYSKEHYETDGLYSLKKSEHIPIVKEDLYQMISDLSVRHLWNRDAEELIYSRDTINQVGEHHVCVIDSKHIDFKAIHSDFGEDKLVYGEVTNDAKPIDELTSFFVLESKGDSTLLDLYIYFHLKGFKKLLYPLVKPQINKNMQKIILSIQKAVTQL